MASNLKPFLSFEEIASFHLKDGIESLPSNPPNINDTSRIKAEPCALERELREPEWHSNIEIKIEPNNYEAELESPVKNIDIMQSNIERKIELTYYEAELEPPVNNIDIIHSSIEIKIEHNDYESELEPSVNNINTVEEYISENEKVKIKAEYLEAESFQIKEEPVDYGDYSFDCSTNLQRSKPRVVSRLPSLPNRLPTLLSVTKNGSSVVKKPKREIPKREKPRMRRCADKRFFVMCDFCGSKCYTIESHRLHMRAKHSAIFQNPPAKCDLCGFIAQCDVTIQFHASVAHMDDEDDR